MQFEVFIMHSNQIKKSREDVWLSSSIRSSFHQIGFCTSKKCIIIVKNKQFSELQICPLILSEMMRRNGFRDLHALHNLTNNIFLLETVQNVHIFCDRLFDRNEKNADLIYCIYIIHALSIIEDEISNIWKICILHLSV